jgi:hypothetical protein
MMKLQSPASKRKKIPYNHNDLKSGSLMVRIGTVTPERLEIESEGFCEGWDRVRHCDAGILDKQLRGAGWRMFFLADALHAVSIGPLDQETVGQATAKLLGKSHGQMFNSFELTDVEYRHFCGVPYVHVTGHARHIQCEIEMDSMASRSSEINRAAIEADHSGKQVTYVSA